MLKNWDDLPEFLRTNAVRPYYDILKSKEISLVLKRVLDFIVAVLLTVVLMPMMIIIAFSIAVDSKGGVLFLQERVTQYGRKFRILKFRTMVANAENLGSQVTADSDTRVTKAGKILRKYRLDELPQLINIILGDMSFCGTRPEVPFFVKAYTEEMMATLLLPAGVTSEASIQYKDEDTLLRKANNVDDVYIKEILPQKMEYNLKSVREFSLLQDFKTVMKTVRAVME